MKFICELFCTFKKCNPTQNKTGPAICTSSEVPYLLKLQKKKEILLRGVGQHQGL
jgi:hypothetical protein